MALLALLSTLSSEAVAKDGDRDDADGRLAPDADTDAEAEAAQASPKGSAGGRASVSAVVDAAADSREAAQSSAKMYMVTSSSCTPPAISAGGNTIDGTRMSSVNTAKRMFLTKATSAAVDPSSVSGVPDVQMAEGIIRR